MNYILKGREPVKATIEEVVARWIEKDKNGEKPQVTEQICRTILHDDILVSTVFLSVKHHNGLFETMVFRGKHDEKQWRYWTYDEAEKGHQKIVEMIQSEFLSEMSDKNPDIIPKLNTMDRENRSIEEKYKEMKK